MLSREWERCTSQA